MVLGYNGSTYDFGAVKCEIDTHSVETVLRILNSGHFLRW